MSLPQLLEFGFEFALQKLIPCLAKQFVSLACAIVYVESRCLYLGIPFPKQQLELLIIHQQRQH